MSKRTIKDISILSLIFIYTIVYRLIIFERALKYSEVITATFLMVIAFVTVLLLGFQKDKKTRIKQYITRTTISIIIIFFLVSYGLGFFVGFLRNAYSLAPSAILDNLFAPVIIIISTEILRYVIITTNKDKKYIIILTTVFLTLLELFITLKPINYADFAGLFKIITATVLPIISKNIVLGYLDYHVGYKSGLVYRLIMDIYVFVMPIVPDLGDYLNSMIGIGLPFIIYIYASRSINEYNNGIERTYGRKTFRWFDIPAYLFLIVLICLISGFFPYFMIGIGSESMTPKINKGDAVIIHKVKSPKELKTGQVIAFRLKDKTIVHRLVKIEKVNGKTYYRTKGDANNSNDNINLTFDNIRGKVVLDIPYIAYPTIYLTEFLNGEK